MNYRDMSMAELLALAPPGWGGVLLDGLWLSLQVAGGGYLLGLLIGMAGAAGKLSGGPVIRDLLTCYTTVIRAVPELVLILLVYFAMPEALSQLLAMVGLGEVEIGPFAAGIVVIALVQGAYATEVMRGAIRAIPYGRSRRPTPWACQPPRPSGASPCRPCCRGHCRDSPTCG